MFFDNTPLRLANAVALPLAVFFAVTAEMTPAGAVHHIARAFDRSIADAALGSTLYALATALVAASLSLLLGRVQLRRAFIFSAACFALSTLATALAPDFATYLGFRTINGALHGAFFPLALALAARASPERQEQSIAFVLLGNACALAIGIPAAEYLSAHSWRIPLLCVGIGLLLVMWFAPEEMSAEKKGRQSTNKTSQNAGSMSAWGVITLGMAFTVTLSGHFAFYTFLGPWAEALNGSPTLLLAVYGGAVILATTWSGHLAKRNRIERAACVAAAEAATICIAIFFPSPYISIAMAFTVGLCFGILPTLVQSEMLARSPQSATLATSIAVVAFNFAIATGSAGGAIASSYGPSAPLTLAWTTLAVSCLIYIRLSKRCFRETHSNMQY